MRRRCVAFLIAILLIPSLAGPAAPADLGLVNEVLEVLRMRHWNPNLDLPALVRAGVGGLRVELQRSGIDASVLQEIQVGADRAQAVAAFGERLDQAVHLAAGRVSERDLLYAGLDAMLKAVGGSHTRFLTPSQYTLEQELFSRGRSYAGVGIRLIKVDGQWVFVSVFSGGPADRAGVRPGDALVRVGDVSVAVLSASEVARLILGDTGTVVQLTLRRNSRELTLSIVRGPVTVLVAESRMLTGGIGYLKIYVYPEDAVTKIRAELVRLLGANPRALIIDLREHGGGDVRALLDTLSLFLPSGTVVFQSFSRSGVTQLTTSGAPIIPSVPVVALIGPGTESAAEMTAAALKEQRGATLVGSRTAGNVERGLVIGLSDGSGLWVSFARIRTSAGVEIEEQGYPPDIEVRNDPGSDRDLQLERAIQVLMQRLSGWFRIAA